MNKVHLIGNLTRDAEVRDGSMKVARYTLAVSGYRDHTDFINCVAFDKKAEFAEKYLTKGTKIAVTGRLQTGSYTNKDGVKIHTTDVVVEEQEFCQSKGKNANSGQNNAQNDGFTNIPDDLPDLPFN